MMMLFTQDRRWHTLACRRKRLRTRTRRRRPRRRPTTATACRAPPPRAPGASELASERRARPAAGSRRQAPDPSLCTCDASAPRLLRPITQTSYGLVSRAPRPKLTTFYSHVLFVKKKYYSLVGSA